MTPTVSDAAIIAAYNDHSKTTQSQATALGLSMSMWTRRLHDICHGPDGHKVNIRAKSTMLRPGDYTAARVNKLVDEEPPSLNPDVDADWITQLKERDATISELEIELARRHAVIKDLTDRRRLYAHDFFDKRVRIGVVSDTHIGSAYHRSDVLDVAYDTFEREEIAHVYHSGDMLAGQMRHNDAWTEVVAHGFDPQVEMCINEYPERSGISTHFITGNHDLSFKGKANVDPGKWIASERSDMHYLGQEEANIIIGPNKDVKLCVFHPGGGTAYALSYAPQKIIGALSGGTKPHILLVGHYHKAEYMPNYRNVAMIQAGTMESQTPFMKRKKLAAHIGFWILDFTVNEPALVSRFKAEFFPCFEG